ncbi:NHLP bacteriocin export ABC transporter permease/ATPase subunit [Anaerolineales bacterium]
MAEWQKLDFIQFGFGESEPLEIGNHKPIILDDPEQILLINEGYVDIFAIRRDGKDARSTRRFLFRVHKGQAIIGIAFNETVSELGILAVGNRNTWISKISRPDFEKLLVDAELGISAQRMLDEWLLGFTSSLAGETALREIHFLKGNQTTQLAEGEICRPRKGVMWVQILTGVGQFLSVPELPLMTMDDFLPLTPDSWLYAFRPSEIIVFDTEHFLTQGFNWYYIHNFHRLALNIVLWKVQEDEDLQIKRMEDRLKQDSYYLDNAMRQLGTILDPHLATGFDRLDWGNSDIAKAMDLIGRYLAVDIRKRPDPIDGKTEEQSIESICRASGLQFRQVSLRDDWWKKDNGPILAFYGEEALPVALIPESTGAYKIFLPDHNRLSRLNPEIEGQLLRNAYTFYRVLPLKRLSGRDLLNFGFKDTRRDGWTLVFMGILIGILSLSVPIVTGLIFDYVIPVADVSLLTQLVILLILIAISASIFQIVQNIAVLRTETRVDHSLQSAMWDRLLNLPPPFFHRFSAGDLSSRVLAISSIRRLLSGTVTSTFLSGIFSIFSFLLLFVIDAQLALAASGLVLIAVLMTLYSGYRKMLYQRQIADIKGRISGLVFQLIAGIAKIRIAGVEKRVYSLWALLFQEQKQLSYRAGSIENILTVFSQVYPLIASALIFVMVSRLSLSTGTFLAFNVAFTQFLLSGLALSTAALSVLMVIPDYERMRPIMETLPEFDDSNANPGELSGQIEISRVSFRYQADSPLVLDDISVQIKPGDFVAIVGPSGSGKSTLLRLLLGFERVASGAIFYDGQDLNGLDIRSVRRQLGVVLQDGQLMTGDIFTNIVGMSSLTLEDAWEAARMAGLAQEIEEMPMSMHTVVSEGGTTLSGGQRQRLLIARAIAQKPKILFFDEATSALDNRTQSVVTESLDRLDSTRVVIAHRLSTIINADQIIVMDKGKIVQQGNYETLVKTQGLFVDLAKRQLI